MVTLDDDNLLLYDSQSINVSIPIDHVVICTTKDMLEYPPIDDEYFSSHVCNSFTSLSYLTTPFENYLNDTSITSADEK